MTKTKTEIARQVVFTVVEVSVSAVVATALKSVCPAVTKTQKVKLIVATYAIAGVVTKHTGAYIHDQMDKLADAFRDAKSKFDK